jgi:hypothetical protein
VVESWNPVALSAQHWGASFKAAMSHNFVRTTEIHCSGTSLPLETNNFSLDPDLTDAWGLPALRMTHEHHPDGFKLVNWLTKRALEKLDAAGAVKRWSRPVNEQQFSVHWAPAVWAAIRKFRSSTRTTAPRRKELVLMRWQQPRHFRPWPAHHDHSGAGLSCRRSHDRTCASRRSAQLNFSARRPAVNLRA